jgi:UDP-N-acetylmuramyl pentapeptide phosphotransferase/UDP-N-acetylglucosamine-1-phosphate transferase
VRIMTATDVNQTGGLTNSGIALVVTQLFRLLFGGYLIGLDQFHYNDLESALSVFLIYVIIGIFTTLFLLGKQKSGLVGLIALSIILIIMESIYIIVFLSQTTIDPSLHDPIANWWGTLLYYTFSVLTIMFAIKIYREK